MKTLDLDLQAIGLTEMKEQETKNVDGGLMGLLVAQALGCAILYGAFMAGYNAGAAT